MVRIEKNLLSPYVNVPLLNRSPQNRNTIPTKCTKKTIKNSSHFQYFQTPETSQSVDCSSNRTFDFAFITSIVRPYNIITYWFTINRSHYDPWCPYVLSLSRFHESTFAPSTIIRLTRFVLSLLSFSSVMIFVLGSLKTKSMLLQKLKN